MRRRALLNSQSHKPIAAIGDICVANSEGDKLFVSDINEIPEGYTPIGVVVIPHSHNVYGTGECCVMSLNYMNYNTPDTGSTSPIKIYYGKSDFDIEGVLNADVVNYIGSNGNLSTLPKGITSIAYLPSDIFNTVPSLDGFSFYKYKDSKMYCPSPFNSNYSRNYAYYTTDYSLTNAFSDYNGQQNSEYLTMYDTDDEGWKTSEQIANAVNVGGSPSARCCWRYHTIGTDQGDWYLPSCAELGYIFVRMNIINNTLHQLIDNGVIKEAALLKSDIHWSSTEYNSKYSRYIDFKDGVVKYNSGQGCYVRAVIKVK